MRNPKLAIFGLAWGASVMIAQDGQRSEEAIRPLVVMLDVKIAGADDYGAGVIASVHSDRLYIATANHVVRKDGKDAESIKVGFSWLPGETRSARLLATYDEQLDLAVILVDKASELSIPPLPFGNIAFASSLKKGDQVFPMGYPSRQPWSTRAIPDAIASVQDGLRFDTNYLVPGNSGGALLTSTWRIAGLVTERNGGQGAAIPIERVMEKLRAWNYQVQWKPGADLPTPTDSPSGQGRSTGAAIGSIAAGMRPGRYEVRLLEVQPLNATGMAQRVAPASGGPSRQPAFVRPEFLDLQIVVNRIPLFRTQRRALPFRPDSGEGVAEVVLQQGEDLQLNLRALTNVPHDGRHAAPHAIQEKLHEGNRIAVNVAFPDGDGDFVFYFLVVRK